MKFFIVKPSPLPILIPLEHKYSHQNPVFKYHSGFMTYPSQSSTLNHPDSIRWIVQTQKFLKWSNLHSPTESLLGPNIRLRILFSNTLSQHSSLNVKDHASHPYSTTGNIIVSYILIFKFLEGSREINSISHKTS